MSDRSEPLDVRRRRLRFRSWHRGIREMDFIMGRFADACLDDLDEAELDDYERLLDVPDQQLFALITRDEPVPPEIDHSGFRRLIAFHSRDLPRRGA